MERRNWSKKRTLARKIQREMKWVVRGMLRPGLEVLRG